MKVHLPSKPQRKPRGTEGQSTHWSPTRAILICQGHRQLRKHYCNALGSGGAEAQAQGISKRVEEARQGPAPPSGPGDSQSAVCIPGPKCAGGISPSLQTFCVVCNTGAPHSRTGWTCRAHSAQVKTLCTMCKAYTPRPKAGRAGESAPAGWNSSGAVCKAHTSCGGAAGPRVSPCRYRPPLSVYTACIPHSSTSGPGIGRALSPHGSVCCGHGHNKYSHSSSLGDTCGLPCQGKIGQPGRSWESRPGVPALVFGVVGHHLPTQRPGPVVGRWHPPRQWLHW